VCRCSDRHGHSVDKRQCDQIMFARNIPTTQAMPNNVNIQYNG
jgi:hypothetical protein